MKKDKKEKPTKKSKQIKRGSMVSVKTSIWLDDGLVTCYKNRKGKMQVPEKTTGVVTFIYSDRSCQVSFIGIGCFMIEEDWLQVA